VADGSATHADVAYWREEVEPLLDGEVRRWVGVVGGADKAALLAGAAALLMPVRWEEPGATVVVEALAAGTPVIGMARGALPELLEHGVTGFLADHESELPAYLSKLEQLDRDACRRSWAQRFTPAHMADGYLAAYAEVLRRARA
jgi:glycosyltransferase involved in cell wall biosynthesis